jgi:hypothetical protein
MWVEVLCGVRLQSARTLCGVRLQSVSTLCRVGLQSASTVCGVRLQSVSTLQHDNFAQKSWQMSTSVFECRFA